MASCDHPSEFQIHDEREGFIICSNCALVLDNLYLLTKTTEIPNKNEYISKTSCSLELDKIYERDLINKFIYDKTLIKLDDFKQKQKLLGKRFSNNELIAHILYWTLRKYNILYTPDAIATWMNINVRKLNEINKYLKIQNLPLLDMNKQDEYDNLITRYISFLKYEHPQKWTFKDGSKITTIIKKLHETMKEKCINIRPQSLSASIIYLYYCYKFKLNPYEKISMKNLYLICKICHVSSYNIKKLLNNNFINLNVSEFI